MYIAQYFVCTFILSDDFCTLNTNAKWNCCYLYFEICPSIIIFAHSWLRLRFTCYILINKTHRSFILCVGLIWKTVTHLYVQSQQFILYLFRLCVCSMQSTLLRFAFGMKLLPKKLLIQSDPEKSKLHTSQQTEFHILPACVLNLSIGHAAVTVYSRCMWVFLSCWWSRINQTKGLHKFSILCSLHCISTYLSTLL